MRIVGGRLRGRSLIGPQSRDVRPTSDRLREAIFNILAHAYDDAAAGARAIDLFAGTGALGLEALSRGAQSVVFVDQGPEALALLRANIDALGFGASARIFRRDATRLGAMPAQAAFTLAFIDPPYGRGLTRLALESLRDGGWLAPQAICVLEESRDAEFEPPTGFELCESRIYSASRAIFLRASASH